jgi:hypothetical protein
MIYTPKDPTQLSDAVVKWLVPERVIYMWAEGDVSASVRDWMNAKAVYMYHSCSTPKIHIIIDMQTVTSRVKSTKNDRPAVWHPRRGWIISIHAIENSLFRMFINALLRVLRLNYVDTPSVEEGLDYLQSADPSLPDLRPYWEKIAVKPQGQRP